MVPYFECFVSCLGSFSCERYVRLMIVAKDPRKITERKKGGFWLTVSEASAAVHFPTAFTPKEKANMPASKTMCLRKGCLPHDS